MNALTTPIIMEVKELMQEILFSLEQIKSNVKVGLISMISFLYPLSSNFPEAYIIVM